MLQLSHVGFRPIPVIAAFSYNTVSMLFLLFLLLTTAGGFWEQTLKFCGKSFLGEKMNYGIISKVWNERI